MALHAALPSLLPAGFPRVDAIEIDGRVLLFTLLLSAITTIVCGALPLLHVRRLEIARSLGDGSAGSAGAGRGRVARVRALIVASQVAVTCVLVIGGVLLARSFGAQINADRGYEPAGLLTAAIPFPSDLPGRAEGADAGAHPRALQHRPGITHAAVGTGLPLASAGGFSVFNFPSPLRGGAKVDVETYRRVVTPGYFDALGIRLRAGRALDDGDTANAPRAVVVNRTFVAKYLDNIPIERRSACRSARTRSAPHRQGRGVHRRRGRRHEAGPARRAAAGGDLRVVCAVARHQSRRAGLRRRADDR